MVYPFVWRSALAGAVVVEDKKAGLPCGAGFLLLGDLLLPMSGAAFADAL